MSHPVPSAREQLDFIQKLRRLMDEGSFVATYKYALLHAIADLCVSPTQRCAAASTRRRSMTSARLTTEDRP